MGKYLVKVNNEDIEAASKNVILMSFLLTLRVGIWLSELDILAVIINYIQIQKQNTRLIKICSKLAMKRKQGCH